MRMDTETISYVLEGHELQNDVQTMIQVFLQTAIISARTQ